MPLHNKTDQDNKTRIRIPEEHDHTQSCADLKSHIRKLLGFVGWEVNKRAHDQ